MNTEMVVQEAGQNGGTMLAVEEGRTLSPAVWRMILEMAPVMYRSRLFGATSTEAAAAILLKGYELGLGFAASFELVQVVQGKPALSPRGAMALLLTNPKMKTIKINRLTNPDGSFLGYECMMERANGFAFTARFTMADAKRAGVIKPGSGWENYPENMCMWRAIGFASDVVAPDITAGMTGLMKMPEQFGVSLDMEGNVIDGQVSEPASATEPTQYSEQPMTMDALLAQYGAEAIIVANEGKIPGTDEELAVVAAKLAGSG